MPDLDDVSTTQPVRTRDIDVRSLDADSRDLRAGGRPRRTARRLAAAFTSRATAMTLAFAATTAVPTMSCISPTAIAAPATHVAAVSALGADRAGAPGVAAAHQRTASTSDGASLTLTGTTPPTLTKGSSLAVTVTVHNTSAAKLSGRSVTLSLGLGALDTLEAQTRWSEGKQTLSAPVTATASVPDLAPGASTNVTVTLPASKISLTHTVMTLPLQLSLTGGTASTPTLHTFATWASTTAASAFTPMSTSIVIPVTLPDDPALLTASGAERFAAWNKAIGEGSAIQKLLTSNPSVPVTWMIDPAVLDPAAAQDGSLPTERAADNATATQTPSGSRAPSSSATSGSASPTSAGSTSTNSSTTSPSPDASTTTTTVTVSPESGATSSSSASSSSSSTSTTSTAPPTATTVEQLAANLLATLKSRPSSQQIVFTPYGDPDLSTLTADNRPAGSDTLLKRSLERQLSPELKALSNTVVAAPAAPLNATALARLDAAWTAARGAKPLVLTPNVTLDGTDDVAVSSAARRSTSGVPLIGYTSALSAALSPNGASGDVDAALRSQATSLALYQQLPSTSRSLLVMGDRLEATTPSRLSHVTSALESSPWATVSKLDVSDARNSGTLAQLSAQAPSTTGVWPQPSTPAFSGDDVSTAAQTLSSLTKMARVVTDGDDIVPAWTRNLDQEASTRWRGNESAVDALVTHAEKTVNAIPTQVHVMPAHINFFSDSGSISVTVKNDLARDVDNLRLTLVPRTYAVQFRSQPDPMSVKARGQTSFRVPVAAQAAGQVSVDARLTSANGVELGSGVDGAAEDSPLQINARPTGTWIFWVLGIVALLVFCYGLLRARQKGTRRRDEPAREVQL